MAIGAGIVFSSPRTLTDFRPSPAGREEGKEEGGAPMRPASSTPICELAAIRVVRSRVVAVRNTVMVAVTPRVGRYLVVPVAGLVMPAAANLRPAIGHPVVA